MWDFTPLQCGLSGRIAGHSMARWMWPKIVDGQIEETFRSQLFRPRQHRSLSIPFEEPAGKTGLSIFACVSFDGVMFATLASLTAATCN